MAYIGNQVQNQGFSPAVDYFNGDGTTVTFTLSRPVASVAQLTAVIENVIQNPSTAFTVSGSSITFTSAPPAGTNNIWVEYTSLVTTYAAVSQDPTVIGDITATGGYLSTGDFGNSYVDGTIVDYVTGNSRITTGPIDDMTFYHGGTASRSEMLRLSYAGNSKLTGNLGVGANAAITTVSSGIAINNATAGNYPGLEIQTAGVTRLFLNANNAESYISSASTNPLVFYTNSTERMRIDSSGRVTTPYQPMFMAYPATGGTVSGTTVLPFDSTDVNVGSHFNTGTYRFTAPVAGTYYFLTQPAFLSPSNTRISLRKNGSNVMMHEQAPVTGWQTCTFGIVVTLAVNDYIDVYNANSSSVNLDPTIYSKFMGYLIG